MKPPEVADGVYRLGTRWANFHLVQEDGALTVIDSGYPGYRRQLEPALRALGRSLTDVAAVVVTHHHIDHAGTAEHLRSVAGARVFVHETDAPIVGGERRSHVPPGFYRQLWRPVMRRYLAHTVAVGGARYRPVRDLEPLRGDEVLDVPGRPRIVPTPGHTAGHCSVLLAQRGVLVAGDALVNFDYAAGIAGVRLHRFNEDRPRALASLEALAGIDAGVVLFGHGDPWTRGAGAAVEAARERAREAGEL